jgi:hypothetical protein
MCNRTCTALDFHIRLTMKADIRSQHRRVSMFRFETADEKEVRRFRLAQFNGKPASVRSGAETITGHVRSVQEQQATVPTRWTITIIPSSRKQRAARAPSRPHSRSSRRDFQ